jgi:membrane-bound lytic murein transglycosylase B
MFKKMSLLMILLPCWLMADMGNYQSTKLTGDFAKSKTALAFIDKVSRDHALSKAYLLGVFSQVKNQPKTLKTINKPTEKVGVSKGSWNRYKENRITDAKVKQAVKFWQENHTTLALAEARYHVPPEVIIAIMSIETNIGGYFGNTRVIDPLATLTFGKNRRQDYYATELTKLLLMASQESLDPLKLKGSYAGAMGYGQFMPSSFLKYMIDFNGDGKKDLWDKQDAIGSIANYFNQNDWKYGKGVAVRAKARGKSYKTLNYGWRYPYTLKVLAKHGIRPVNKVDTDGNVYYVRLVTHKDYELWIGGHNFYVITRYNNSSKYALTTWILAQKIKKSYQKLAKR